jgi:hypothetical protein
MVRNHWAVICPEPDAPGTWGTWVKERCVAIGWPPPKHHLLGPTHKPDWEKARNRAQAIQPGDIIIPFLMDHTFGTPGIVKRVAIKDVEWNPTVLKGGYANNPGEGELGRRIEVRWLKKGVPPLDKVAVMPASMQEPRGAVRATIEPVRSKRYARFMRIISDPSNWKRYENKKANDSGQTPTKLVDDATKSAQNGQAPAKAARFLIGDDLYLERARRALPLLVRQAYARKKIYYSDFANELGMSNPRNLNHVLGAVGRAIQELAAEWKQEIPPLQCIVVNKNTGIPGNGLGWFLSDLRDFARRTAVERRQIVEIELVKVFNYEKWEAVLGALNLTPLSDDPTLEGLKAEARSRGGVGECEDHRELKHFVATHPEVLGISGIGMGTTEYIFPSADRIDVVFRDSKRKRWVGVEVKGPSSDDADILRGLFQCVKYSALREAELRSDAKKENIEVILVLSGRLTPQLKQIRNLLGVEVMEGVIVP